MHIRNLTAAALVTCLVAVPISVTRATAQTPMNSNSSNRATVSQMPLFRGENNFLVQRELDVEGRMKTGLDSGVLPRARFDQAKVELNNIRVQESELSGRDRGLNATDRDFIMARIAELERSLDVSQATATAPVAVVAEMSPALSTLSETPGALTCDGRRVLLSIGRNHATASVQRYGSANVALIVEAVASPFDREDAITLRVTGAGLNAVVDGARAGQYLMASTTTNFSLKSKQSATILANVISHGRATPQYVKVWGSCSEHDSE